jgi:hypothetical protein
MEAIFALAGLFLLGTAIAYTASPLARYHVRQFARGLLAVIVVLILLAVWWQQGPGH